MPRDMLGDAATLGDGTDTGKARVIMRNGKYPAVPAQSPVFADYAVGDVEQADEDMENLAARLNGVEEFAGCTI